MSFGRTNGGYVYLIQHEHGFMKIGSSNDPMDRLNSIRGMTPYDVYLKTTIEICGDRTEVEKQLHDIYDTYNVTHEWFDLPDAAIDALTEINRLHLSTVEEYDGWTPRNHINIDDAVLAELRGLINNSDVRNDAREMAAMITREDFERSNLDPENDAVARRARKLSVSAKGYIKQVRLHLDDATPAAEHDAQEAVKNVKAIINDLEDDSAGARINSILDEAELRGHLREDAKHEIEKLRRQGDVYEPTADHLRTV
jgi:hypothetical protein